MTTIRGVANTAGSGGNTAKKPSVNLDDVSKTIIELLQHDGRKSYASIAQEVGLSEAAVRQRVQRLLDADVMQIVAVTDPLQVGFQRQAMVGLRVSGDMTAVADALTKMDEVSYVVTTAGSSTCSPRSSARTTPTCSSCSRVAFAPFRASRPPRRSST